MFLKDTIRTLQNPVASLSVDLNGGAIRDFHIEKDVKVNPLSFAFEKEDMPLNNRNGAPYRGHFLCLGRWGEPSEGERRAGLPNHGQAANLLWEELPGTDRLLEMAVNCPLEGLYLERRLQLDGRTAAFAVEETVRSTAPLGRLYNMVQHPTLAAPFLDEQIRLSCNATKGFDQFEDVSREADAMHWPYGRYKAPDMLKIDLSNPSRPYTSVFSFLVNPEDAFGFITAWSPSHQLLLGYVWERKDYPWIHLWQDWDKDRLRYLGIEFGTAALHQPFPQLLASGLELFGERTTAYLDAGEKHSRRYLGFLHETAGKEPVSKVNVVDGGSQIILHQGRKQTVIETDFSEFLI